MLHLCLQRSDVRFECSWELWIWIPMCMITSGNTPNVKLKTFPNFQHWNAQNIIAYVEPFPQTLWRINSQGTYTGSFANRHSASWKIGNSCKRPRNSVFYCLSLHLATEDTVKLTRLKAAFSDLVVDISQEKVPIRHYQIRSCWSTSSNLLKQQQDNSSKQ